MCKPNRPNLSPVYRTFVQSKGKLSSYVCLSVTQKLSLTYCLEESDLAMSFFFLPVIFVDYRSVD